MVKLQNHLVMLKRIVETTKKNEAEHMYSIVSESYAQDFDADVK